MRDFGPPQSFALEDYHPGSPGPGEVLISVHAAGVSFVDVLLATGEYQVRPPLPFIPGSEFSGTIKAAGCNVDPLRVGERVFATAPGAAFANLAVVPAERVWTIPDSMTLLEAAIFKVSYSTAYYALVQRAALQSGESLLVLGAGGAIGYASVEIGKALGAHVIASASTDRKRALAKLAGADALIDSHSRHWRDDIKIANYGKAIDVVIDPVGGMATEPAFRSLAWGGRHLVVGFAEGTISKLPVNLALLKGASLVGVDIRQFGMNEPEAAAAHVGALFDLYHAGKIHPPVGATYPLARFADAMSAVRNNSTVGRSILVMD